MSYLDYKSFQEVFASVLPEDLSPEADLFYVREANFYEKEQTLRVDCVTIGAPSAAMAEELRQLLEEKLLCKVEMSVHMVSLGEDDREEIWNSVAETFAGADDHLLHLLLSAKQTGDEESLRLQLPSFWVDFLRRRQAAPKLEALWEQVSGRRMRIGFVPMSAEEEAQRLKDDEATLAKAGKALSEVSVEREASDVGTSDVFESAGEAIAEAATEAEDDEKDDESLHDEVLFGHAIRGSYTPLGEAVVGKRVNLLGVLASFSERSIKNDKVLVTMVLTDDVAQETVKSFIPTAAFEAIRGGFKKGQTYCVKGTCKQDDFAHMRVVIANHITKCAIPLDIPENVRKAKEEMLVGLPYAPKNERRLRNLEAVTGEVTVKGDVILTEATEDRNGQMGLVIDVTDYTGAISVYATVDKDTYRAVHKDLEPGSGIEVFGVMEHDYHGSHSHLRAAAIRKLQNPLKKLRTDDAPRKRVELHAHTKMSEMDAVSSPTELVNCAAAMGHTAVAITDHGVVQGFPEAMTAANALQGAIKVIYGVEAYLVDDLQTAIWRETNETLDDTFVVFDIETTGFNKENDDIIEIGAVKVRNGQIIDRFSEYVNPKRAIPKRIVSLTGISDADVDGADPIEVVLPKFLAFSEGCVFVAHNASFDTGFIETKAAALGLSGAQKTVVDTLGICRGLFREINRYTLDAICRHLDISLENHHRACDDAEATAKLFLRCVSRLLDAKCRTLTEVNAYIKANLDVKRLRAHHAIILVKNPVGLRNLYELISLSHLNYLYRTPRLPKSELNRLREGLIVGSACSEGEIYQAVLDNDTEDTLERLVGFYDYLEIQPLCNNQYLIRDGSVADEEELKKINRRILALGEQARKPVVATCDVHFVEKEDGLLRKIILSGKGFDDTDFQPDLYFRTTDEMLAEFHYLGREKAEEVVIDNPQKIADQIEVIKPIPDGTFAPKLEGADEELKAMCYERAHAIYGDTLPEIVEKRLERELGSIIKNGFASLYIIAQRLVSHSNKDGYVVGSRGSVGSSFVATMAGITEVNPLPAHYYCPECRYSEFDSPEIAANGQKSGFDLPDKVCPNCGAMLAKNGHTIPFETFLGFDGDKEPDIDLNFSGEYQPSAHAYTEELFGKDHVFRAGTMSGLAEKTAFGYVKRYLEEHGQDCNHAEISRLTQGCSGIRRTTGQHPGGQIVVPKGYSIYQFCPVQYPANKADAGTVTTHFDYRQLHDRLLKLDILGHDDPTMIKMLTDLTGIDATAVPLDNPKVMSLFLNTDALGVTPEQIGSEVGTYGIPEFGTHFVRQMLLETKPQSFSDLVRISGLSHGTDVWNNNAQDIIKRGEATISEVICTRDDIMTYLIQHDMDKLYSFKMMEAVRKGKGLKPSDEAAMASAGVPDWYIQSCKKIQYLFPKGHATAYVMMSLRVAYFKIYHKEAYYAAFFSIRANGFNYETMCMGEEKARAEKMRIEALGKDATEQEKATLTTLELVIEAYCRGVRFAPLSLETSGATRFCLTKEQTLLPPFTTLDGLGAQAAERIVSARAESPFITVDDFCERTRTPKTNVEQMRRLGLLRDLPESMQVSLF